MHYVFTIYIYTNPNRITMTTCRHCGQNGHSRISHRDCLHHPARLSSRSATYITPRLTTLELPAFETSVPLDGTLLLSSASGSSGRKRLVVREGVSERLPKATAGSKAGSLICKIFGKLLNHMHIRSLGR
jgi:hypothetical protein